MGGLAGVLFHVGALDAHPGAVGEVEVAVTLIGSSYWLIW